MKKIIITSFVVLFSVCYSQAQIKVFNTNNVQVGPNWWPTFPSTKQLFINGGLEVREFPGTGMFIQNYNNLWNGVWYDDPSIVSHFNYGGWVGTPSQAMFAVYSNLVYATTYNIISDARMKSNIRRLDGGIALSKINQINAYRYDYNENLYKNVDEKKRAALLNSGTNQFGFMAQELKEVVPEAVKLDENTGIYSINYIMLIPILVEALKEQQLKIEQLDAKILELQNK